MNIGYLLFALFVIFHSSSQMLEKIGLRHVGQVGFRELTNPISLFHILTNGYIFSGVVLAVFGLVCWLGAISRFEISYIYAFTAVSFMVVTFLAWLILKENVSIARIGAFSVLLSGLVLLYLTSR
jgi:uncharacterized membrane protein